LSLAIELFPEVRRRIELRYGKDTKFHRDLSEYLDYRCACEGVSDEQAVDLEALMSYLDIEHYR
jgi:predicted restriction endonuclease